ncbi:hypothetical protein [Cryobacterium sp. CG_9.6]|uniref:hypothetical protein n=1 Tax=Cryobacterium sp. CG_9.6 TaxID=2760710 RepID=UPI0024752CCC|nr:hypothetical protein [Cryobacterium sp. CG_9.6]MDH6237084.1 hypothetical protein [Cryobacterium sp. CG_9.6]
MRLLEPRQADTFRDSIEVQLVSTAQALAECTADAVADGLDRGMTAEGALIALADLVDAQTGLVQIVEQDADQVDRDASALATIERLPAEHSWHLAAAEMCFAFLAEPEEKRGFGADDGRQAEVARARGWTVV